MGHDNRRANQITLFDLNYRPGSTCTSLFGGKVLSAKSHNFKISYWAWPPPPCVCVSTFLDPHLEKRQIISTQHGKMVHKQIFHFSFFSVHVSLGTMWGNHYYKNGLCIQSPARICTNTLACRVHKIMDKTSVHGCAWDHGLPLSLIFDQRVLQSGERSCTLKTNNKFIFFLL